MSETKIELATRLGRLAGFEDSARRITNDHPESAYKMRSGTIAELAAYHEGYHSANNTLFDRDLIEG